MALKLSKYFATTNIKHLQTLPQPSSAFTLNHRTYLVHISSLFKVSLLLITQVVTHYAICFASSFSTIRKCLNMGGTNFPTICLNYAQCSPHISIALPVQYQSHHQLQAAVHLIGSFLSMPAINIGAEKPSMYGQSHTLSTPCSIIWWAIPPFQIII